MEPQQEQRLLGRQGLCWRVGAAAAGGNTTGAASSEQAGPALAGRGDGSMCQAASAGLKGLRVWVAVARFLRNCAAAMLALHVRCVGLHQRGGVESSLWLPMMCLPAGAWLMATQCRRQGITQAPPSRNHTSMADKESHKHRRQGVTQAPPTQGIAQSPSTQGITQAPTTQAPLP